MKLSARDTTFPNSCIAGTVVLPRSIKFRIVKSDIPAWQRSMNGMLDWEQLVGMAMVKRWQMLCKSTNWRSKHSSEMASYYAQHVSLSLIIRLSFVWFSLVAYGRLLLKSWIIIPCYAGGTFSGTIDVYLTKSARYGRKLSLWVGSVSPKSGSPFVWPMWWVVANCWTVLYWMQLWMVGFFPTPHQIRQIKIHCTFLTWWIFVFWLAPNIANE